MEKSKTGKVRVIAHAAAVYRPSLAAGGHPDGVREVSISISVQRLNGHDFLDPRDVGCGVC